jgi:peroxiredoxin
VQKVWLDVKPEKHSAEVLAALSELQKNGSGK